MTNEDSSLDSAATSESAFSEERLRLEREALAVERERLQAARAHAEAAAQLAGTARSPAMLWVCALLLAALAFAIGLLSGMAIMENRYQRQREERLSRALSQIEGISATATVTNISSSVRLVNGSGAPDGAHRNVQVMVIQ